MQVKVQSIQFSADQKLVNFINQKVRKLKSSEKNFFNLLLRGAALRFLFTRINDSITISESKFLKKKSPEEFFNILNYHINNQKNTCID